MEHQEHEEGQDHQEGLRRQDRVARSLVDEGLKVHRALGPGLLESVYEACLARELDLRGLRVCRQVAVPVQYEGVTLEAGYRLEILVENCVILEITAVDQLTRLHEAQLLTYLRLSKIRLGLLMNFNTVLFKHGVRRLAL